MRGGSRRIRLVKRYGCLVVLCGKEIRGRFFGNVHHLLVGLATDRGWLLLLGRVTNPKRRHGSLALDVCFTTFRDWNVTSTFLEDCSRRFRALNATREGMALHAATRVDRVAEKAISRVSGSNHTSNNRARMTECEKAEIRVSFYQMETLSAPMDE